MIRKFFAALTFLTVFPAGRFVPGENDLAGAVAYFPWVGVLLGVIGCGAGLLPAAGVPMLPAAMCLVIFAELLTKALHLDGLADTADAFLSGRDRARKLEIMRDSHIGTMGVFAVVAVLGMKFALLASLTARTLPWGAGLMLLGGRCAVTMLITFSRYARPGGLGAIWFRKRSYAGFAAALLLPGLSCFILGWRGALLPALLLAAAYGWSRLTETMIGGSTGDTIGAAEELGELVTLGAFCVMVF